MPQARADGVKRADEEEKPKDQATLGLEKAQSVAAMTPEELQDNFFGGSLFQGDLTLCGSILGSGV